MLTAQKLPQALQDLLDMQADTAQTEIRRLTRCSLKEAGEVYTALQEGFKAVAQFPDLIALLLGDPQPAYLKKFADQRPQLLRKVRRGNRLEAIRDLTQDGELNSFQARSFLTALKLQGENWQALQDLYARPQADFFERRPQAATDDGQWAELVFAPEQFDSQLLLQWLDQGQYRSATRWVRQLSGAPREDCQAMIDRLEEMVFDNHPDPWRVAARLWPGVVAPLTGMPNPDWLEELEPKRQILLDEIANRHLTAASQIVMEATDCSAIEARRFLRLLDSNTTWEQTLKKFLTCDIFPKPLPRAVKTQKAVTQTPLPKFVFTPPAAASTSYISSQLPSNAELLQRATQDIPAWLDEPSPLDTGTTATLTGAAYASPWAAQREKERQEADTARQQERDQAEHMRQTEMHATELQRQQEHEKTAAARQRELEETDHLRHQEHEATQASRARELEQSQQSRQLQTAAALGLGAAVSQQVLQPPLPLDLSDTEALLEKLNQLGQACAAKNMGRALLVWRELEQAGFNRAYFATNFPMLIHILPDEPWSDHLAELSQITTALNKILKGGADPIKIAQELLPTNDVKHIVSTLEKAWQTKNKTDITNALELLHSNPQVNAEVSRRLPWLSQLNDLDHDGKSDILEVFSNPGAYFADLLRSKFPELEQRLGEARVKKIKEAMPELSEAIKNREMRNVLRILSRLKIGPSDVNALMTVLKHMHQ